MKNRSNLKILMLCVPFVLGTVILSVCVWAKGYFNAGIGEIIFTIATGAKGADTTIVTDGFKACLPVVLTALAVYLAVVAAHYKNRLDAKPDITLTKAGFSLNLKKLFGVIIPLLTYVYFVFSLVYLDNQYKIVKYLRLKLENTTIYEDYYVDPDAVAIEGTDGRNLIVLYMESLENAYASLENGGFQQSEYLPFLTRLAKEETNFSDNGPVGGFHGTEGSNFTVGALFSIPSAIPFSFPVNGNEMGRLDTFAAGTTNLYDILDDKGYAQYFLCGSDAGYGARDKLFYSHGIDEVYDYYTATDEGYVPDDYHVGWGLEDCQMYAMAKDKILKAAASGQPFSFSMLTVDTHFPEGFICSLCSGDYPTVTENVVQCTDRQAEDFISWCRQQEFFENTTILIVGDHRRMDLSMVEGISDFDRTVYTCFVNSQSPLDCTDYSRSYTQLDLLPTTLSALGYTIEGDRLGLGANLFSDQPTLLEILGYEALDAELSKSSDYYTENFS